MPGMVVSLAVDVGQDVRAGDTLCVVEAMKMENVLEAERDGKVSQVSGQAGRQPQCRRRDPRICVRLLLTLVEGSDKPPLPSGKRLG